MERLAVIALIALSALTSCSTAWQSRQSPTTTTYQASPELIERSTGRLRSLLLLPTEFRTEHCHVASDAAEATTLESSATEFLTQWKGYDILAARPEDRTELSALSAVLGTWQDEHVGADALPEEARSRLRAVAHSYGIDGVLVLHAHIRCLRALDIVGYALIIGMPNWARILSAENVSAGIYASAERRLVWLTRKHLEFQNEGVKSWPSSLFDSLERAVPGVLAR